MKHIHLLPLLGTVFFVTTGASIIDRETKTHVLGMEVRLHEIARQEMAHHVEIMRQMKEQRQQIQTLSERIQKSQAQVVSDAAQPAQTVVDAPEAPVLPKVSQAVAVSPAILIPEMSTSLKSEEPHEALVSPAPPASKTEQKGAENSDATLIRFSIFGSVVTFVLLVVLLVRMKRGEDQLRRMIWKSEMNSLREDLTQTHPVAAPPVSSAVNPKIHVTSNLPKTNVS